MSDNHIGFSVEQKHGVTTFKNETQMYLEISVVPVKPKRKYETIMVIPPGTFKILDVNEFDLSKFCFAFSKRTEE